MLACFRDAALDGETIVAGVVLREDIVVEPASDVEVVGIVDLICRGYPWPHGAEGIRAFGPRVIDEVGVGILFPVQPPPGVELRPRHIRRIGYSDAVLHEFEPMTGDIVVDQEAEDHVQRILLPHMLGTLTDHGADLGLRNDRTPVRIDDDLLSQADHAGGRLEEEIGDAGVDVSVAHQLPVVEGDVEDHRRIGQRRRPVDARLGFTRQRVGIEAGQQVGLLITGADQAEHVVDPAQPCGLCHVGKNTHGAVSASDDGLLPAIKDTSAELHADPSCWRENLRG